MNFNLLFFAKWISNLQWYSWIKRRNRKHEIIYSFFSTVFSNSFTIYFCPILILSTDNCFISFGAEFNLNRFSNRIKDSDRKWHSKKIEKTVWSKFHNNQNFNLTFISYGVNLAQFQTSTRLWTNSPFSGMNRWSITLHSCR